MVGMPGLEPGNPEGADLQSAAVAAVPHPHFPFSSTRRLFFAVKRRGYYDVFLFLSTVYTHPGVSIPRNLHISPPCWTNYEVTILVRPCCITYLAGATPIARLSIGVAPLKIMSTFVKEPHDSLKNCDGRPIPKPQTLQNLCASQHVELGWLQHAIAPADLGPLGH